MEQYSIYLLNKGSWEGFYGYPMGSDYQIVSNDIAYIDSFHLITYLGNEGY